MSENTDQAPAQKKSLVRRIAGIVAGILIALAIILLIICMNLGTTVKVVGEKLVTQLTKGETTIGDASISLLSGRVTLSDIQIKNPTVNAAGETISFTNDSFFKLGKIDIDLNVPSLLGHCPSENSVYRVYYSAVTAEVAFEINYSKIRVLC